MVAPIQPQLMLDEHGEPVSICGVPCVMVKGLHFELYQYALLDEYRVQQMVRRLKPRQEL